MRINSNQKKVIIAAMALVAAMALFPPWTYTFKYRSIYSEEPADYSFVGNPPSPKSEDGTDGVKIDVARLSIQTLAVLALMGIGILVLAGESKHDS